MLDLSTYTGAPLNAFVMDFIRMLQAEGFTINTTHQGPVPGERKTLRIYWRDVWIGQMKADLWSAKKPFVCLYRFPGTRRDGVAHAPLGFDKSEFAKRHGCNPDQLHVNESEKKFYLLVQDAETALLLLRARVKRINES